MVQVGEIELYLAVEPIDRRVEVVTILDVVAVQCEEARRIQFRDEIKNACFEVIHVGCFSRGGPAILYATLLEPLKCRDDTRAVVGFAVVTADSDTVVFDQQTVSDRAKII